MPSEQANITCEDIVGWYGYNFMLNGSISTFGYRYSPNCDDGFCVSGEIIHHSLPTLKEEKGEHTHKSIYHDCNTMSELLLYKSLAKRFIDETPMKFIFRCLLFAFNFLFVVVGSYFLWCKKVEWKPADVSVAEVIAEVEIPDRADTDRNINISVAEVVAEEAECPDSDINNISVAEVINNIKLKSTI